jgi:hypothetical protein
VVDSCFSYQSPFLTFENGLSNVILNFFLLNLAPIFKATRDRRGGNGWLNNAIMVSNTYYVVGNQSVVLASTNFVNWTNIGTITTKSLEGTASQNGQLVVDGFEGTILRSQILPV